MIYRINQSHTSQLLMGYPSAAWYYRETTWSWKGDGWEVSLGMSASQLAS